MVVTDWCCRSGQVVVVSSQVGMNSEEVYTSKVRHRPGPRSKVTHPLQNSPATHARLTDVQTTLTHHHITHAAVWILHQSLEMCAIQPKAQIRVLLEHSREYACAAERGVHYWHLSSFYVFFFLRVCC